MNRTSGSSDRNENRTSKANPMTTQATTQTWQDMERRAFALVPSNLSDRIPMRETDGGRAIRFKNSRVTLPVIIG